MTDLRGNRRAAGRGKKYPRPLRTCVSDEQLAQIRDSAERAGMSVCRYLRERATGGHVSGKIDVKTLQSLHQIGRLLKKMWAEGHPTGPALDAIKSAAQKLEQSI